MIEGMLGLIGVIIGFALGALRDHWSERSNREKSARYLAVRVIAVLDQFVEDCERIASDEGLLMGQRKSDGCLEPQVRHPDYLVYPEDIDWQAIDDDLMQKLLWLPTKQRVVNQKISGAAQFSAPPDFDELFEARRIGYADLGLEAVSLADQLRKKYRIAEVSPMDWIPAAHLGHIKKKLTREKAKYSVEWDMPPSTSGEASQ